MIELFGSGPMIVEYLKNQAARCMSLARVCFDLETARQLRLLAEDLKAKADEIEARKRAQARPMQQQPMQQQQQAKNEEEE
jgi:precorrin-6B methylase 1